MSATSPWLYQTSLGEIADVWVTHNLGFSDQWASADTAYAGNLGLHVGDSEHDVLVRRAALERRIGKPIQWLNQVHGVAVAQIDTVQTPAPTADAACTSSNQVALALMTADCLPLVLVAQHQSGARSVALAHAGWRGLLAGVIQATVQSLNKRMRLDAALDTQTVALYAHIGPCIGPAQFEVGAEVFDAFVAQSQAFKPYFSAASTGKYLAQLEGLARQVLADCVAQHPSIKWVQTTGGGWCTHSDPRLASYRRRAKTGRFATLVTLR